MMAPARARASQALASSKAAAVCSSPPSCAGVGMSVARGCWSGTGTAKVVAAVGEPSPSLPVDSGSMYRYICVVKRLGGPLGVIHRVKGMRFSGGTQVVGRRL